MDKTKLIQLLGLAEDATDEDIVRAIKAGAKAVGELAEARAAADAAEADKSAIANERDGLKTALANERAARIGTMLDRAIAETRITPADRPRWEGLLAADFEANRAALANEAPKLKTAPAASATAALATAAAADRKCDLVALANEKMKANPRLSYTAAFAEAMKEHPEIK